MTKLKDLAITITILCTLIAFLNWQNGSRAHGSTNSNSVTQTDPGCKVTVEAQDGTATPAEREQSAQVINRLCAALNSGTALPQPTPDRPGLGAQTRQACEDLHKQGFMTDVDCSTVTPAPHYYYHR